MYKVIETTQDTIAKTKAKVATVEEQIQKLLQEKEQLMTTVGQLNGDLAKLIVSLDLNVQKLKSTVQ